MYVFFLAKKVLNVIQCTKILPHKDKLYLQQFRHTEYFRLGNR